MRISIEIHHIVKVVQMDISFYRVLLVHIIWVLMVTILLTIHFLVTYSFILSSFLFCPTFSRIFIHYLAQESILSFNAQHFRAILFEKIVPENKLRGSNRFSSLSSRIYKRKKRCRTFFRISTTYRKENSISLNFVHQIYTSITTAGVIFTFIEIQLSLQQFQQFPKLSRPRSYKLLLPIQLYLQSYKCMDTKDAITERFGKIKDNLMSPPILAGSYSAATIVKMLVFPTLVLNVRVQIMEFLPCIVNVALLCPQKVTPRI